MKVKFSQWCWWVLSALGLFLSCDQLERNNPLDPQNPNSERRRVVLVEAFVNASTPFSAFALAALDSLALSFSPQHVLIVEYHLPSPAFADPLALPAGADRYKNLTAAAPAVPDVFFNGVLQRAQGASNASTALSRYRSAIQNEIDKSAYFTLAAQKTISPTSLTVDVTVARLGNSSFENFIVGAMVWEDLAMAGRHHVVRKLFAPENFSRIAAGEKKTVRFTGDWAGVSNIQHVQVAVILEQTTSLGREVLQATLAE